MNSNSSLEDTSLSRADFQDGDQLLLRSPIPSFVHTSSFSIPTTPVVSETLQPSKMPCLHPSHIQALSDNVRLASEKQVLEDRLTILTGLSSWQEQDPALVDATIASLRGKLLDDSRRENEKLRQELAQRLIKLHELEQAQSIQLAEENELSAVKKQMAHTKALSEARARAVDRLDQELVQHKQREFDCHEKLSAANRSADELQAKLQHVEREANQLREANERLQERLLTQGLDLRVVKGQVLQPMPSAINIPRTPLPLHQNRASENDREMTKTRESELERQVSALRKELEYRTAPRSKIIDALKDRLSQAVTELKLTEEDRAKERAYYNGLLAAYSARINSLESKLKKDSQHKREVKYYKFMVSKYQAELAAFVARSTRPLLRDG